MSDTLVLEVEERTFSIDISACAAPATLRQVLSHLPSKVDIHCAKIAGSHIMWPVPFLAPPEKSVDVLSMEAGSFFYWPERQYLEITYAPLQAESASVNYLGQMCGDVDWLRSYAGRQRRRQGEALFTARMYAPAQAVTESAATPGAAFDIPAWNALRNARIAAWSGEPADIRDLLERTGEMLPFGPLSMAEAELRKLHELLWRLWIDDRRYTRKQKVDVAAFAIDAAVSRVSGFCGMHAVSGVLEQAIVCMRNAELPLESVLEEAVLYAGRIAAWLDLHIPWWPMNELLRDKLRKRHGFIS